MPKAFSINLARSTLIVLAISALPAMAAYNDQPDCAAVSNGARAGVNRANAKIDEAATNTGTAIDQAKTCVDELVALSARSISDFGGSFQIPDGLRRRLAEQGCRVLNNAATRVNTQISNAVDRAVPDIPAAIRPALDNIQNQLGTPADQAPPTLPSLLQRLTNLF